MESLDLKTVQSQLLELVGGSDFWALTIQVFIVVFLVVLVNFVARRAIRHLQARAGSTRTAWDDALLESIGRPLNALIWVVGIAFAAEMIYAETQAAIFQMAGPARTVGVIAVLAWFLFRLVRAIEQTVLAGRLERGDTVDRTTIHAIGKLVRVSIMITAALVGMQSLGFSISGVLAFGGIGGIAVGFAAKDLLANFFGGLMVYLDRPFAVGDWVRSPDKEIEGTVEDIGWRLTRIRTFDKRPLYVPNSVFTQITVENPSRMSHRRIYETIGIRYDDLGAMGAIVDDVKAMLKGHPEIDQSQTMIVNFNRFNDSSVDFFVYTFTRTTQWVHYHEVKQDVLLRIAEIIERHGAEIAFPTRTLHVPESVQLAQAELGFGLSPAASPAER